MTAPASRYARCPDEDVVLRELEGLTLVYHRPSGLTHMLASPLPEIWAALTPAPQPLPDLLEKLSAQYDLGDDADAQAGLESHLAELLSLGLIGSDPCAMR